MEKNVKKFKLGEQLSRLEMKQVLGGYDNGGQPACYRNGVWGAGYYATCSPSGMSCSGGGQSISSGYCSAVWPSSGGYVACC